MLDVYVYVSMSDVTHRSLACKAHLNMPTEKFITKFITITITQESSARWKKTLRAPASKILDKLAEQFILIGIEAFMIMILRTYNMSGRCLPL